MVCATWGSRENMPGAEDCPARGEFGSDCAWIHGSPIPLVNVGRPSSNGFGVIRILTAGIVVSDHVVSRRFGDKFESSLNRECMAF